LTSGMVRTIAVAAMVLPCACQRDYSFRTVAEYQAPRSGYSIRIDAQGVVRAGADVSEHSSGVVAIWATNTPGQAESSAFAFNVALRQGRVRFGPESLVEGSWHGRDEEELSHFLSDAGLFVAPEEMQELSSAVEGALLGPKGTLMAGQTKVLGVVSTTFDRSAADRKRASDGY
jgi:hypothetical protein